MISLANGWAGYYQEATVKGSMGRATTYAHDNPRNCLSKDKTSGKIKLFKDGWFMHILRSLVLEIYTKAIYKTIQFCPLQSALIWNKSTDWMESAIIIVCHLNIFDHDLEGGLPWSFSATQCGIGAKLGDDRMKNAVKSLQQPIQG